MDNVIMRAHHRGITRLHHASHRDASPLTPPHYSRLARCAVAFSRLPAHLFRGRIGNMFLVE
jgi:hypothetical protein